MPCRDFDTLIGTAGVLPTTAAVQNAFKATSVPYTATSLTRADYNALLNALLPQLAAVASSLTSPKGTAPVAPAAKAGIRPGNPVDLADAVRVIAQSLERLGVLAQGTGSILPEKVLMAVRGKKEAVGG